MKTLDQAVRGPLTDVALALGLERGRIGYEQGPTSEPASYMAMSLYGAGVVELLRQTLPSAHPEPADEPFRRLDAAKTPRELDRLRVACRIAEQAFRVGAERLRAGLLETEAAAYVAVPLSTIGTGFASVGRGGYAWCMSGLNAAEAQGAYARSRPSSSRGASWCWSGSERGLERQAPRRRGLPICPEDARLSSWRSAHVNARTVERRRAYQDRPCIAPVQCW